MNFDDVELAKGQMILMGAIEAGKKMKIVLGRKGPFMVFYDDLADDELEKKT